LLSGIVLLQFASASPVQVTSTGKQTVATASGFLPINPDTEVGAVVIYQFNAHPGAGPFPAIGNKKIGTPFKRSISLKNENHGSEGRGSVDSSVTRGGPGTLDFKTTVTAEAIPGAAENMPISMRVNGGDPIVVEPGFGGLAIDFFLGAGSSFLGIPTVPGIAEDPSMSFGARVAPGAIPDPLAFFGAVPNAVDLYAIDIAQSQASGLIEPTVTFGSSNSFFSLAFSDSAATVRDRIINAFIGTPGNFDVPGDTLLFSLTVTPQGGLTYTFGAEQVSNAPDVEVIPEPSSRVLSGLGMLTLAILCRRAARANRAPGNSLQVAGDD
jgi:hypothetical protein